MIFFMANENFILLPKSIWKSVCDDIAIIKNRLEVICPAADCDEYLSSEEARKFLGVSKRTWQTYRDQHRVPFSVAGRKIYVKKADLVSFMESNKIC